jgi:hypothetical protein
LWGTHEEPLTTVLSWPAALKTLHYDVEQYGWEVDVEFSPKNLDWTCAAFMRTLQWQKATLVELTMTRPWDTYKYIDDGPRLDLSEFTSLKTPRKICDSETGEELPVGLLTLPSLEREAKSTGIELKMWLGYQGAPTMRKLTFPSP